MDRGLGGFLRVRWLAWRYCEIRSTNSLSVLSVPSKGLKRTNVLVCSSMCGPGSHSICFSWWFSNGFSLHLWWWSLKSGFIQLVVSELSRSIGNGHGCYISFLGLPQRRNTTEIYALTILGDASLKLRCLWRLFFLEALGGESVPCFSPSFRWLPATLGIL